VGSSIRSQLITDVVFTRISTLAPSVAVYRSEVVDNPPSLPGDDRVGPYVVLYPFPGHPGPGGDLGGTADDLDYTCQVTCAAGYAPDCEHLVDRVHQLLYKWTPSVAGIVLGQLNPPPGYDPGPVRIDRTISPPRFSVPLQYRLTATAN
jgi:hypothetical protein